jgi:arylsulfatase
MSPTVSQPWSRRRFLEATSAGAAWLTAPRPRAAVPAVERPDILVIAADDLGFADLGCYGSEIHTPNLDRLAAGGVRFAQGYAFPRCCPSRAALLTGRTPHEAGLGFMVTHDQPPQVNPPAYQGFLRAGVPTLAERLRAGGYRTCHAGKWHVGEHRPNWPCDRGFESSFGLLGGAASYFDPSGSRAQSRRRRLFRDDREITLEAGRDFYLTDEIARAAIGQIESGVGDPRPLFLYLAFTAPHWPLHAIPEDIGLYRNRYGAGWDEVRAQRHRRQLRLGLADPAWGLAPRDPGVPAWNSLSDPEGRAHHMAVYAAQVHRLDLQVGRVLDALTRVGRRENTLILFVSDNGGDPSLPPVTDPALQRYDPALLGGPLSYTGYGPGWAQVSNTPFRRHKRFAHEGGIAIPFLANGPGFAAGGAGWRRDPATVLDIVPTCLAAAGIPAAASEAQPGRDLRTPAPAGAPFTCGWEHMGNRAYRDGPYKLVAPEDGPWELYHLGRDRAEGENLATREPARLAALVSAYEAWARRTGVQPWPVALNGSFG